MFDQFLPHVMGLFGFSKGKQVENDMKNFDKLTPEQKQHYDKVFAGIKDSDINSNTLHGFTQTDKRNNVVYQICEGISNYVKSFGDNLSEKTS